MAGARSGAYRTAERTCAEELWPLVLDQWLTLVDRGFVSARTLIGITRGGAERHWLTRARTELVSTRVKRPGGGDELIELAVSSEPAGRIRRFLCRG